MANVTAGLDAMPGRQIGDPVRGVAAILEIVGSRTAPLLPLSATRALRVPPANAAAPQRQYPWPTSADPQLHAGSSGMASEDIAACANGCGTENG